MIRLRTFNVAEMFNDSKGKTSLSKVMAAIVILSGCMIGIVGCFRGDPNYTLHGIGYITPGLALLGYRRSTPDKEIDQTALEEEVK